jgi:hypothetical protein
VSQLYVYVSGIEVDSFGFKVFVAKTIMATLLTTFARPNRFLTNEESHFRRVSFLCHLGRDIYVAIPIDLLAQVILEDRFVLRKLFSKTSLFCKIPQKNGGFQNIRFRITETIDIGCEY